MPEVWGCGDSPLPFSPFDHNQTPPFPPLQHFTQALLPLVLLSQPLLTDLLVSDGPCGKAPTSQEPAF